MPEGWLPALYALNEFLPLKFKSASAMMDRAEFPVHKKRTLYCVFISKFRLVAARGSAAVFGFNGTNKPTHELAFNFGCYRIYVYTFG